ncbi:MAG: DNA starvation/stationary phase protection protein Dps [Chloroflexi bacterium]|nr:DNA starvation/stationary phase protection protein Dps [Chloroflexota bacterium]
MPVQTTTLHKTKNDLSEKTRTTMVELLNQQLADTFDLYSQTKQAHWNVKGPHFIALHELFDKLAGEVLGFVDELAERATSLGGTALGTARMAAAASSLPEYPADLADGTAHVKALVDRWAAYAASTRAAIDASDDAGDATTADLFTQISGAIDKDLWFLEAHIQK